jgi:heme-degrading monooxygenase HmoA
MTGYAYVWEFVVRPERTVAFERAYGSEGEWVALFRRASGYRGTLLLRDRSVANRYVTIDRWCSEEDYRQFLAQNAEDYRAIDDRCGVLTLEERSLGVYEE